MSGFRYGPFHDGPDPLAGPLDAGAGVDDLAQRIMDGQSVEDALRDLMREGTQGRRGMREMARQVRDKRRRLEKSGAMDGLLQDLRDLVEQAKDTERRELFPDPSDDARFREAQLDNVPDDVGRAMQQLANYDWRSDEARALFEQAQERLRRDVVDQQFRNLSSGIDNLPQERQALQQMMQDLNDLLDTHRRGDATQEDYDAFIARHRQFFPDAPATLDELIDDLARRQAAMQRMLDSMSPEQRAALSEAMSQAMQDMGLTEQMAALQQNLQSLRPEFGPSGKARMSGSQRMGLPQVTEALAELSDLEALDSSLNDGFNRMDLDDIDEEAIERALGRQSRDDLESLRELQRQLEQQGFLVNDGERLELTPKAIRRIGRTALRQVFSSLDGTTRGQHDITRSGASGEFTGTSREWTFGSEQPIDVVRTVRRAMSRRMVSGGDTLMADDFEVHETETTTRAAVALLIDQSFSMVVNDTWRQAKTMALALHTLASTAYPLDAMQIIAFANVARVVQPHELPDLEASHIQGTNLHHALMLAGRFLDSHPGAQRIVMVVTDGEPTARLMPEGYGWFSYPPEDETIAETIAQVDRMTRRRVPVSWFRLGDDPSLERFLDGMARRNGGRVLAASADRLGDYVVSDYVRTRRAAR
ncbi:MAG: hypothetical protein ORN20_08200 [Candidatus Nanopelagicales bacterium]|nr:hypothetical protein [Candidatus Nanopelagicales bacterium]